MICNYLYVFFGGGLGTALRYWLSGVIPRYTGSQFPYGILIVNIAGCFFIGFLMSALEDRFIANSSLRIFFTIGLLGGFTTFSTFSYETIAMMHDGEFLRASLYVGLSLALGLGATHVGSLIGKLI